MSTEERLTTPDYPQVYVTWGDAKLELPLSPARAKQLVEALNAYADRCRDVKSSLEAASPDTTATAYNYARDMKHAQFSTVLSVMESVLAHIAVHAR